MKTQTSSYKAWLIWAILIALTTLSWSAGHGTGMVKVGDVVGRATVLIVAFVKIRIVIMNYMEIGEAPWRLRGPFEIWCVAVCGALLYLLVGSTDKTY